MKNLMLLTLLTSIVAANVVAVDVPTDEELKKIYDEVLGPDKPKVDKKA